MENLREMLVKLEILDTDFDKYGSRIFKKYTIKRDHHSVILEK